MSRPKPLSGFPEYTPEARIIEQFVLDRLRGQGVKLQTLRWTAEDFAKAAEEGDRVLVDLDGKRVPEVAAAGSA